jgi:hypothetical protein
MGGTLYEAALQTSHLIGGKRWCKLCGKVLIQPSRILAMTLQSEDASVRESKIKLRTAYVTLLGVFFGVLLTGYQIYNQN